jgi:hypothetical protein
MTTPFDFINSISYSKNNMMRDSENDELMEKDYNSWVVNKGLSYYLDTILYANEMNMYHDLQNRAQYEFLLNSIRPRKRFSKWFKEEKSENLDIICEYYRCNRNIGKQYLKLLTEDQIQFIKEKQEKGGTKNGLAS